MQKTIYNRWDNNIAGSEWKTCLVLTVTKHDGMSLSVRTSGNDGPPTSQRVARRIRTGIDLYEAVQSALSIASIDDNSAHHEVTACLAPFNPELARQYEKAPALIEANAEAETARKKAAREETLEPFRHEIERRLEAMQPSPVVRLGAGRYTGGTGYDRARLEKYVLEHGLLPPLGHCPQG
ncbi:hypothetical protein GGQ97_001575 [Sphingomonas kaistensis]|uniref:Uncharacterized protein n=1 Tax=Sphingomonas kaistensis TaxID=298708 RepID=A0A7X6BH67_9SPHN|nr:hypothetical protein [Sphingomonas kaistensis]NJC05782.1 hypothetical protein [Sphingomonas kaistensis]